MPWKEKTVMDLRLEFCTLVLSSNVPFAQLCRRFSISRKTGYKWLNRYSAQGRTGLEDRSRRPHSSPLLTPRQIEDQIIAVRTEHPAWGPRKIIRMLTDDGHVHLPSASTVNAILRRSGCPNVGTGREHRAFQRFEAAAPNDLWQMDFKGDFPLAEGRCYPLTVIDDHSRHSQAIVACQTMKLETVQEHLSAIFCRYGMPCAMIMDNGAPWGSSGYDRYSEFDLWLMERGVAVMHSRPYHPQTCGKIERFHRSLKAEVLAQRALQTVEECQASFDQWRDIYNTVRPHEALDFAVPAARYAASPRPYPEHPPQPEYTRDDIVRSVSDHGDIFLRGQRYRLGKAFARRKVAMRTTAEDGVLDVMFLSYRVAVIDLHDNSIVIRRHAR